MNRKKWIMLLFISFMIGICILKLSNDEENKIIENIDQIETKVLLYFYDETEKILAPEYRIVSIELLKENIGENILLELLKGPTLPNYQRVIPEGTKVNATNISGDKMIIDLSKEFIVENETEEEYARKIFSIVYTLTEIKEINEIEIYVDGKFLVKEERM